MSIVRNREFQASVESESMQEFEFGGEKMKDVINICTYFYIMREATGLTEFQ